MFLAKSKDSDHHQEMNSVAFLEWYENQWMAALKNPSLIMLDNASYHNVKTEDTVCPNFSQKKLFSKTILHNTTFLFLLLIPKKYYIKKKKKKKTPVVYKTDTIANLHGHEVLRTPVRH